jgi:hypothetical protein
MLWPTYSATLEYKSTIRKIKKCVILYKCGTLKLASKRFMMLKSPSPRIRPLASTIIGVSLLPFQRRHHKLSKPPIVRARVKLGVLYIPGTELVLSSEESGERTPTNSNSDSSGHKVNPPSAQTSLLSSVTPYPHHGTKSEDDSCSARPFLDHGR